MLRFKRSQSIYMYFEGNQCIVSNFLSKQFFTCNSIAVEILAKSSDFKPLSYYLEWLVEYAQESIGKQLVSLVEAGALIVEGTPEHQKDEEFESSWEWHISSAAFHFGSKNGFFIPADDANQLQEARTAFNPSPPLYKTNENFINLELPTPDFSQDILKTMSERRTHRAFLSKPISLDQLAACLFSGLGIVGFYKNPKICDLPIKMTPSGGARNPYEGYVYVLNVYNLSPGIYHYSALEHSLGRLPFTTPLPLPATLFGNQEWLNEAAAVIILVANFHRTMWKYPDGNAYKVVLIEAGHIGQNIALTATSNGLSANPTSAICDRPLETVLHIDNLTESAVLAMALGYPDNSRPS